MTPDDVTMPESLPGLIEGRIVHYVLESGRSKGEHRPAIVVRDWKQENGLVQLQVFTDGENDGLRDIVTERLMPIIDLDYSDFLLWRTSVPYSEDKEPGTWHWISDDGRLNNV